jgi:hypothetical protein
MSFHYNTFTSFGNNRNVPHEYQSKLIPKINVNKLIDFEKISDQRLIDLIIYFKYGDNNNSKRILNNILNNFDRAYLIDLLTDTLKNKQENLKEKSIEYFAITKKTK